MAALAACGAARASGPLAYIPVRDPAALRVLDTATKAIVAAIPLPGNPSGVAITPDGNVAYVSLAHTATGERARDSANTVAVVSTVTGSVIAKIRVGEEPHGLAITPDGQFVYVGDSSGNFVRVISTATNSLVTAIAVGKRPENVAVTPDGSLVYTANELSGTVSMIRVATNAVVNTISVGSGCDGLAIAPDGAFVYTSDAVSGTVSVIDTAANAVAATIPTGLNPHGIAITPDGKFVYVVSGTAAAGFFVSAIDTATDTVVAQIPESAGGAQAQLAVSPDGGRIYVSDPGSDTLTVIATAADAVIDAIPMGHAPGTIVFAPGGSSHIRSFAVAPDGTLGIASVSVSPATVTGGGSATGSVTLTGAAPAGGILVELWTDGFPAYVPTGVTVPAGASVATFPVTTDWTTTSEQDTITAFYQGLTATAIITVAPAVSIASVSAPATVTGGVTAQGSVTLNAPAPPGGVVISLWTSGFPAYVPLSVTIAAGSTTAAFTITTVATSQAAQPVITAFYNGSSAAATMTVTPSAALSSVSVTPGTITASNSATGTVTLNSAAPAGGLVIELWTSGFPAFVPTSVTVPAGATTATFPVTTSYTTTAAQSTITAFYSSGTTTTTISVTPAPTLASVSAPGAVVGGNSVAGSVSLTAPAPAGGAVISLWTSGFPAFVPTSVTIAAGSTTAAFTITTDPTSQNAQPVITAFYIGAIQTTTMTVTPPISHQATLNWIASTTPSVTYNVYRGSQSGGPYSKINPAPVVPLTYVDTAVTAGQTYYYVVTAVASSGLESGYSNEASGTIPSP
ncbi:MAG TPA: beta-propeller fold lactonase family protein [Bryobacteraceae bacterium]|nr:beta-propeller fold lactonase family protein [Bryobacteraceae bacterium]